jgi:hypothetical protein
VPSWTKIATYAISVCIKFGSERHISARKGRRKKAQADSSVFLLTVKIRQPSHEFTFGVGMNFIPYPLVLTPVV